jgi:DNA-binding helix-hairpin-helix protein with protein kinase domain
MIITLKDGRTIDCMDDPFGGGADGETYWTKDGRLFVKLYHHAEPWRSASLDAILTRFSAVKGKDEKEQKYWENLLCWPTGIVVSPRLGLIAPRAEKGLKKLACFIVPKWLDKLHPEDKGNWNGRLLIALRMARSVKRLQGKGLCHSDLSENNILANSTDGRTYVIDIDGLVVPGLQIARPVVDGTKGFIAPELVAKKVTDPSVQTDLHALAVLIYQILFLRHPLEGKKIHDRDTDRDDYYKYGERALFIEHPTDPSNRPEKLPWSYKLCGPGVAALFEKAFVQGLHNPKLRPLPMEWERDLTFMADVLVPCLNPKCDFKYFPMPDLQQGMPVRLKCPWCGSPFGGFNLVVLRWQKPVSGQNGVFRPDGTRKVAWPKGSLYEWHTTLSGLPSPNMEPASLATFDYLPQKPGPIFLLNQHLSYLEAADPGGSWKRVPVNQAVELKHGRKLRFNLPGQTRDAVVELYSLL